MSPKFRPIPDGYETPTPHLIVKALPPLLQEDVRSEGTSPQPSPAGRGRRPALPPRSRVLRVPGLYVVAGGEAVGESLCALRAEGRVLFEAVEDEALELRGQGTAEAGG